ncbi:phosphoglycerate mutase [Gluconobacter japonicus]|uniref:Histidine phosphatase family protein n=1 Tax=Gluconobacter japonicus TaxID=376620 RepID=A0A9Q2FJT3_GLUJA|nr:histidine phosphatase family protein [Gluconobacter japonicus]KXV40931.1 phosphoglycerate mutase [Gluconobacter japonicus]MBF0870196.1 histidine phosphatase family protein [Gluconobacter japonicus]
MNTPRLWLIRHGETDWTISGQHTGRTDIPLTENGREQARALKSRLADQTFDQVFCSPLQRAYETCELAGFGSQVQIEPDLMEWDYGVYEGRTSADILKDEPGWSLWTSDVQNGETAEQVRIRVGRLLDRLLAQQGTIALFAHGHILRSLISMWVSNDVRLGENILLDTASISVLGFQRNARVLRKLNT